MTCKQKSRPLGGTIKKKFSTRYFTGHCTGQEQYAVLKEALGDRIGYLHTGTVIDL